MSEINRQIITVIGSTRFRAEINQWAWERTKEGKLVLFAPFAKEEIPELEDYREELEAQHFQKIRMADEVFVFNRNEHIGESTYRELMYARILGKVIKFLEPYSGY